MRKVLAAAAAAGLVAALAANTAAARPGPHCGGPLWKLMTLADNGKGVNWNPAGTTVPAIAKLAPPARIAAARTSAFERRVWELKDVVIERYRVASSGELVLELFDVPSSTYMDAYVPSVSCMTSNRTLRRALVGARNGFTKACPAPTAGWQMLGAHATILGVGFWDPVKTTQGALSNGAELRPLVGLTITQGCGKG